VDCRPAPTPYVGNACPGTGRTMEPPPSCVPPASASLPGVSVEGAREWHRQDARDCERLRGVHEGDRLHSLRRARTSSSSRRSRSRAQRTARCSSAFTPRQSPGRTARFAGSSSLRGIWLPIRLAFGVVRPRVRILGQEFAGEVESLGDGRPPSCPETASTARPESDSGLTPSTSVRADAAPAASWPPCRRP